MFVTLLTKNEKVIYTIRKSIRVCRISTAGKGHESPKTTWRHTMNLNNPKVYKINVSLKNISFFTSLRG